jgi:hypothetical protein
MQRVLFLLRCSQKRGQSALVLINLETAVAAMILRVYLQLE